MYTYRYIDVYMCVDTCMYVCRKVNVYVNIYTYTCIHLQQDLCQRKELNCFKLRQPVFARDAYWALPPTPPAAGGSEETDVEVYVCVRMYIFVYTCVCVYMYIHM